MKKIQIVTTVVALTIACDALAQRGDDPNRTTDARPAQQRIEGSDSSVEQLDSLRLEALMRARSPVHTAPTGSGHGDYGTWATGADYKVSFHDGFTFIPMLGEDYPYNQPFSWQTVSVTVGGQPIADLQEFDHARQEYRYEYRFDGVTEAYDVKVEGVEQTFVIARRPNVNGDLIVSGRIETKLRAGLVLDAHQDIVFRDKRGEPILRYGAAFAFDANGYKVNAQTSFDGTQIHLRVPGAWLETAAYPVTIDPLVQRECVDHYTLASGVGKVLEIEIARDDLGKQFMVAYTRATSATDIDMWCSLFINDACTPANRRVVYLDVTSNWSVLSPAIGFAGGAADKWIIAFLREQLSRPMTGHYHLHASGNTSLNTTFTTIIAPSRSSHQGTIDVGGVRGSSTSSKVFVVYDRTDLGSNSEIFGMTIDLVANVRGPETRIPTSPVVQNYTRIRPDINQVARNGNDGWVVAYQEYWDSSPVVDEWDIRLRRIDGSGKPIGPTETVRNARTQTIHKMTPRVSGSDGHYALAMCVRSEVGALTKTMKRIGNDIWNETFNWPVAGNFASVGFCELTIGLNNGLRWRVTDNAHDNTTASHWATAFENWVTGAQFACTSGFDAGKIERLVAYNPAGSATAFAGAVVFNNAKREFVFAYGTDEIGAPCGGITSNNLVYCQVMQHLPSPTPIHHGIGCGNGVIGAVGRNLAGNKNFEIRFAKGPANVPVAFLIGLEASRGVPLDFIGMTGCSLNLTPNLIVVTVNRTTDSLGRAKLPLPLPTCPVLLSGKLYFQCAYVAPGLNPLGVGATTGLFVEIISP